MQRIMELNTYNVPVNVFSRAARPEDTTCLASIAETSGGTYVDVTETQF